MKISIRRGSAAAGLALAAALTATPALAGDSMVVGTSAPASNFGPATRANLNVSGTATNLAQRFYLPETVALSSLEFYGTATNIDLYITNAVGEGTASDITNVMWESHGFSSGSGRAWREVETGSLVLGPGTYFLVMAADNATGGIWAKVGRDGVDNVEAFGVGTYPKTGSQRAASINYSFEESDQNAFAFRLNGAPIPTPGAFAITMAGGLACMGRRRR